MRHHRGFPLLLTATLFASVTAHAVPVFLQPNSRFATGNQARSKLEPRTHKSNYQRWFRVITKDKQSGWIAEDHALTALKLVEQATLTETVPSRTSTDLESSVGRGLIPAKTPVLILEVQGSMARVQPLTELELPQAWVPTDKLKPNFATNIAQRAFVYQTTPLHIDANSRARILAKVEEGTYVQVVRIEGSWIEIRSGRYQGYVAKSDVWTAGDLGENGVRAAVSLAPLRKEPLPYADLIRSLSYSATLTAVKSSVLKWGLASTREQGEVWWPMTDSVDMRGEVASLEQMKPTSEATEKISTEKLFQRKMYDMATSRAIPTLKFASADGIFRTTDGASWTRIPLFRDQNYPIAVAKNGSIFIGPYVSYDHGETFQQWIKWDSLVSSLEARADVSAQNLKIVEIKPEDAQGHRVTLRLNVGRDTPVRVATDDQGTSWRSY
jgi:SH3-like domain-containing protein